jgi:phage/plasmid-like protein (TIGR03299 family)
MKKEIHMSQNLSIFEQAGKDIPTGLPDNKVSTVFGATGLDWLVEQKAVYVQRPNTDMATHLGVTCTDPIPNLVANYRSDNGQYLGMVHPRGYKIVQNAEAFDFIDELPNFTFEKVGMFNGGKKVFVVGKSNEQIDIDGTGDLVDFYLTFLHGHDGKSGIRFILCPVRMFCMNQLNLMLESATFKYNIAHTGDIQFKLAQIQMAIADSRNYVAGLQETIDFMINHKISKSIEQFTLELIPMDDEDPAIVVTRKEEARNTIISLYNDKPDLQNYKGTQFGVISAVSDYVSHAQPKRISHSTIDNTFIKNIEGSELLERTRLILAA